MEIEQKNVAGVVDTEKEDKRLSPCEKKGNGREIIEKKSTKEDKPGPSKKRRRSNEARRKPDDGSVLSTSDEATLKLLKHVGKFIQTFND